MGIDCDTVKLPPLLIKYFPLFREYLREMEVISEDKGQSTLVITTINGFVMNL